MSDSRKTILFIATSLDGYIAGPDDDLSFLDIVSKDGEDYGYADFMNGVDTVITGRRTYDWVMRHVSEYPHKQRISYVITREKLSTHDNIIFYSGDLNELILRLKGQEGKNIFVEGGSDIVNSLLNYHLIDEFIISVVPVLKGNGIRLFKEGQPESLLELISVKQFDTGLIQVHYRRSGIKES